ncbi:hypothetical protein FQN55_000455 [Onygenales sp. PD_40]|nr:hypothetical protein FQN55_000455 [Onygenales sp. PD_40]KAK2767185.1 hypothetical protein FQN53_006555 [Emmonsiellopsis sp. PD_33]KAK2788192.1 hypothetical protein FQN52_006731 [Onygenales sp. PD_12]KAK2795021.1 hypothetical protein FQN51_000600 [Onygenales sp. PD_10]
MLSRALQKANAAVLLDNATNYEGAIEAYSDACQLLQQVMQRSGGNDEKQKLEEIRNTYTSRINELRRLGLSSQRVEGKALPDPPSNEESPSGGAFPPDTETKNERVNISGIATPTTMPAGNEPPFMADSREPRSLTPSQIPPRRQSLLPSAFDEDARLSGSPSKSSLPHERSHSHSYKKDTRAQGQLGGTQASVNSDWDFTPAPRQTDSVRHPPHQIQPSNPTPLLPHQHSRDASNESTSWLDTIDESGASSNSSIRSRSSLLYIRPKHTRNGSGGTEAEFDAALDAAVEAAYDEGLEPARDMDGVTADDIVSNARRNVELAKQRVREAQMESEAALAKNRDKRRIQEETLHQNFGAIDTEYEDAEAEEEERILEEMMADFEFDLQSKSALPRQSDSSGFSGRTWGSSVASNLTTAGTSLSTLAEGVEFQSLDARVKSTTSPPHPPPATALPPPPVLPSTSSPPPLPPLPSSPGSGPPTSTSPKSVRVRRLNGQNTKELSIETSARPSPDTNTPRTLPPSMLLAHLPSPLPEHMPKTSVPISHDGSSETKQETAGRGQAPSTASNPMESLPTDSAPSTLAKTTSRDIDDYDALPSPSHIIAKVASAPDNLRKNISSSSLKALKARGMSVSTPDVSTQTPSTPSSATFPTLEARKVMTPSLPPPSLTPTTSTLPPANNIPAGGMYLFDNNIHSPTTPGSPNPSVQNAPLPLEPCPQSFLLRPFWLMRCLYQTIAHPRGGYLTAKLFVPRDVWRVQNVKLKAVEEKISNCDLLTAALLKLAKADTYDADAVLEEMQAFENVLDQVQNLWSKKLGNEVGVQGSMALFKSPTGEDVSAVHDNITAKSSSGSSKSYLTSWRKLRSKSSGTGAPIPVTGAKDGGRDTLTMNSVPMTDNPGFRTSKINVTQLQCTGPNASYMSALARLFDAAQVLDQIARQVEDPGLKHSSQTLVGLELSTRHASEFFGFYVCRFALNDIGLMIDKFIKRGSEWVLV